jgi:hypothetical protein
MKYKNLIFLLFILLGNNLLGQTKTLIVDSVKINFYRASEEELSTYPKELQDIVKSLEEGLDSLYAMTSRDEPYQYISEDIKYIDVKTKWSWPKFDYKKYQSEIEFYTKKAFNTTSADITAYNTSIAQRIDEKRLKKASIAATPVHGLLALFINEDYNDVNEISLFIQRHLNFNLKTSSTIPINNKVTWLFKPKISHGSVSEYIRFEIATAESEYGWITKTFRITGTPNIIAKLFISYWPTKMKAGQTYYIQKMGPEDITFTIKNGVGIITITKR